MADKIAKTKPALASLEEFTRFDPELAESVTGGGLAKVAAAIAEADANIENINFSHEDERTALYFTLEVNNRLHLANIMRSLRRIPEVVRIIRVKNAS